MNSYYEKNDLGGDIETLPIDTPFKLPSSWAWVRLSNVFAINPKNNAPDDTMASFIPMASIETDYTGRIKSEVKPWSKIKKGFTHFANGDIVFSKISPCFENGKYFIASDLINGIGSGSTELFVLRPYSEVILREYAFLYLSSKMFITGATKTFMGTVGQQRVKRDYVEGVLLPVPPVKEQRRLVDTARKIIHELALYSA